MKYKIILITLITILLCLLVLVTLKDKTKEEELTKKAANISVLLSKKNPDIKLIKEKLSNTSKGKYSNIENSYNKYMLDVINKVTDIKENIDTNKIESILSIENIKADGQEFKDTTKFINITKKDISKYKKEMVALFDNKKVMSYLNKDSSNRERKIYKRLINYTKSDKEILIKPLTDTEEIITKEEIVIKFLKDNKDHWEISENNIAFTEDKLLEKYNSLLKDIK